MSNIRKYSDQKKIFCSRLNKILWWASWGPQSHSLEIRGAGKWQTGKSTHAKGARIENGLNYVTTLRTVVCAFTARVQKGELKAHDGKVIFHWVPFLLMGYLNTLDDFHAIGTHIHH